MIEKDLLKRIIEGAIFSAGEPVTVDKLLAMFGEHDQVEAADVRVVLEDLSAECVSRGYELKQVASGYRFQLKADISPWLVLLWDEKPAKYSRAVLETLALIAYRQPVTRAEIEDIRGVTGSSSIIKTLMDREWVRLVGHRDVPGRPGLYATTKNFLDYFNLKSLDELPTLAELIDLDAVSERLGKQLELDLRLTNSDTAVTDAPDAIEKNVIKEPIVEISASDEEQVSEHFADRLMASDMMQEESLKDTTLDDILEEITAVEETEETL